MTAPTFQDAHRCLGEVRTGPYGNKITVAASAAGGKGSVFVHGRTISGHHIGGLLSVDAAHELLIVLEKAITYAKQMAELQVRSEP